jgi:phosphate transport system substrate-binding protein
MAVAEVFEDDHPDVILKVERSGTGGGFDKFSRGETHISNASRPIKSSEAEACQQNGIAFTEVMVGTDGLTVVVNPQNDWCRALTIEQLAKLWAKDSTVSKWSDLDPAWPAEPIKLFGADAKSGTYDYFKEETVGKDNPMRTDYQPNSDDNVLVEGVAGDKFALGFFGFAYYVENSNKLKSVAIAPRGSDVSAAVAPSPETIEDGSYTPLSRPLFIYINNQALQRPEVKDFAEFHISDEGQKLVKLKGYIPLNAQQLAASREKFQSAVAALAN